MILTNVSRTSMFSNRIVVPIPEYEERSILSQRLDDRSTIRDRRSSIRDSTRSTSSHTQPSSFRSDERPVSNCVQAQIERMFTDVAKDATSSSFAVRCLGSLPLKEKVTSLQGLQDPLRQLYLSEAGHGNQNAGNLDICATGLRVRLTNGRDPTLTPFHNIAVWSAVKFVVSASEGGAAFLPLITDPENIDKRSLFMPLSAADKRRLSSGLHAPIFSVVMRSATVPKQLDCHGFVCQSPEDAIVIAATLYQSLMAHMGDIRNQKPRKPRNQNGVSCISIGSSATNAKHSITLSRLPSYKEQQPARQKPPPTPSRPPRKKRSATSSLSGESDIIVEPTIETSTDDRKKKSYKTKRAPPIPTNVQKQQQHQGRMDKIYNAPLSKMDESSQHNNANRNRSSSQSTEAPYQSYDQMGGDILTRIAIPRSGSFLNAGGLTRYKSRATRRQTGKSGGGGGSPLGFSELFNEFRLQENLHSLDEILNAIINSDGMSFNDLKPIYKEFLLKLAVTLTKDELYQRSKTIMRRQKKKKLKRKSNSVQNSNSQKSSTRSISRFRKVFSFGKFRRQRSMRVGHHTKTIASIIQTTSGRSKKATQRIQTGTSGSDVSEPRNDSHTLTGQNRNSSSGYVSCSECSYDSEDCTCTSADRCYCSLGADHENVNSKLTKPDNRDSLLSCQTEDKCYCSLEDNREGESSDTTWCDSDSCISNSKCYCGRKDRKDATSNFKNRDNLALDYELFTVGGGGPGKAVRAQEALSVKKTVEMAALFGDVKLSQSTDITSLAEMQSRRSTGSKTGSRSSKYTFKKDTKGRSNSSSSKVTESLMSKHTIDVDDFYQPIITGQRPVSVTLEDSLGYLP